MSNKVWILTSTMNDYNQHGEYFEAVWFHKPTYEDLKQFGFNEDESEKLKYIGKHSDISYDITAYEKSEETKTIKDRLNKNKSLLADEIQPKLTKTFNQEEIKKLRKIIEEDDKRLQDKLNK